MSSPNQRTLLAWVEARPGTLGRVVSLFRQRDCNLRSLSMDNTERPGIVQITAVVDVDELGARRLVASLYKLLEVILVRDLDSTAAISREIALVTLEASQEARAIVAQLGQESCLSVAKLSHDRITVQIAGPESRVEELISALRPFGILEVARARAIAAASEENDHHVLATDSMLGAVLPLATF